MSRRRWRIASDGPTLLTGSLRLVDVVLVMATGALSYWLREQSFEIPADYLITILASGILTANVMHIGGIYTRASLQRPGNQIGQMLAGWAGIVLGLIVLAYFTKTSGEFSRVFVLIWALLGFTTMMAARLIAYWQLRRWRRQGLLSVRIAIVGSTELAQRIWHQLQRQGGDQYEFAGVYDDGAERRLPGPEGVKLSGTVADLIARFREDPVDEVVIALAWHESERIAALLKALKTLPANVRLCPEAVALDVPTHGFVTLGGIPMLGIFERPLHGWNLVLKSLEDRIVASMVLILTMPLFAAIALAIKLDSRGPVLFGQRRYGFNNNPFTVHKFRTMAHLPSDEREVRQATRNDPRVTRLGALLRRTSLDELPQIFNVLKGEMSLVGPRPHAVAHNEQFAAIVDDYLSRHRVKPGITGWAQVNGLRGEIDNPAKMQLRVQYDLYYIDNWSLLFDLKILCLTVFVGFVNRNAY